MNRLVRDDRKAKLTQITTRYKQGMQNTISERTTRQTLKQMGYSSIRCSFAGGYQTALHYKERPSGLGGGGCLYSS